MATIVSQPRINTTTAFALPRRRFERLFFSATAWLMLLAVFVGFAPTYYLAGVFHAPLPSAIVHVHGAAFTCWILLLVIQTSLVASHRVDLHKKLGIAGFCLAVFMVIVGVWAATDRLARGTSPPRFDPYLFYLIPLTDMVIFVTLMWFAFRLRRDPSSHKRIIYIATTGLLIAAIARWPWGFVHRNAPRAAWVSYLFLMLLASYDWWSLRKVHRATIWAGAFLIFVQNIRLPIAKTAAWHSVAAWVQSMAR